jgi:hypothetical protein
MFKKRPPKADPVGARLVNDTGIHSMVGETTFSLIHDFAVGDSFAYQLDECSDGARS